MIRSYSIASLLILAGGLAVAACGDDDDGNNGGGVGGSSGDAGIDAAAGSGGAGGTGGSGGAGGTGGVGGMDGSAGTAGSSGSAGTAGMAGAAGSGGSAGTAGAGGMAGAAGAGGMAGMGFELASVDSGEAQHNGASVTPSVSENGRFVAFESDAVLDSSDTNGVRDIYLRDRTNGTTVLVSVSTAGSPGNGASDMASISSDGRYVAFRSTASNLVAGDQNAADDVFVRDTQSATTSRVSIATGGGEANAASVRPFISGDGTFVVFDSVATNLVGADTNVRPDVYLHNFATGTTTLVSATPGGVVGSGGSFNARLTRNGRFVVFESRAANLIASDTNASFDVLMADTMNGTITRLSVDSSGTEANADSSLPVIAMDGQWVAFVSAATNLVAGDTNAALDVFLHNTATAATTRVSVDSAGVQGDRNSPSLTTSNVLGGPASISADGNLIAFNSDARNLVAADTNNRFDVFVHNRTTGTTSIVSSFGSTQGDEASEYPALAGNGSALAFQSLAGNLHTPDTNASRDVFIVSLP